MVGKSDSDPVAGVDLLAPWDFIVGRVKLYRKSHDQIGRYRMELGEKTASRSLIGRKPHPSQMREQWHYNWQRKASHE